MELAVQKQISALDHHCRAFISRSPFLLVGTANGTGVCDVSPKGDPAGFVQVLDDNTLVIPDRPGNRRADTLVNILENPQVGLLFLIPGVEDTLRVNGRAHIVQDEELLERTAVKGRKPLLVIVVDVQEAFLHCAKAFKRSLLWGSRLPDRPQRVGVAGQDGYGPHRPGHLHSRRDGGAGGGVLQDDFILTGRDDALSSGIRSSRLGYGVYPDHAPKNERRRKAG